MKKRTAGDVSFNRYRLGYQLSAMSLLGTIMSLGDQYERKRPKRSKISPRHKRGGGSTKCKAQRLIDKDQRRAHNKRSSASRRRNRK